MTRGSFTAPVNTRVRRVSRRESAGNDTELATYGATVLAVVLLVAGLAGISAGVVALLACGGGVVGGWRWERKRRSRRRRVR